MLAAKATAQASPAPVGMICPLRGQAFMQTEDDMNFRCTTKAQRRLRLTPSALASVSPDVFATDWHCNVVTLGKRPFFLFAHSLSLYAFYVPVAGNSNQEAFAWAFRQHLAQALAREGLSASARRKLMDDGPDTLCKATDRRVIGTMVDHAHMSQFAVGDFGRVDEHVLSHIHKAINESPMSVLGMERPRHMLKTLLLSRGAA
jgi:hypothetical protein